VLVTNYSLKASHFGFALDITPMLLLYYYSKLLQISPETINDCYLICPWPACSFVAFVAFLANK